MTSPRSWFRLLSLGPSSARGALAVLFSTLLLLTACGDSPSSDEGSAAGGEEASYPAPAGSEAIPIPVPNLEELEPIPRERVGERQRWQAEVLATPDLPAERRAEAFGELGRLYHVYGLVESAEACYRNAQQEAPDDAQWPYLLGQLYSATGNLDGAVEAFRRTLELEAGDLPAQVRLGGVLLEAERPGEAANVFRTALETPAAATSANNNGSAEGDSAEGDSAQNGAAAQALPAARYGLGRALAALGQHQEAVEELRAVLSERPEGTIVWTELAQSLDALGDSAAASEARSRAGDGGVGLEDPRTQRLLELSTAYSAYQRQGGEAFQRGDFPTAAQAYALAVAVDPLDAAARQNLALTLRRLGQNEEAAEQLRIALRLAPAKVDLRWELAQLETQLGRADEGRKILEELLEENTDDLDTRLRLAMVLESQRQLDSALAEYQRILAADGERVPALLGQASTLLRLGRYAEARDLLDSRVSGSDQPSGEVAHALARLLATVPDDQVRDGQRALNIAQSLFDARQTPEHAETLAMALAAAGEFPRAAELAGRLAEAARQGQRTQLATYYQRQAERYASNQRVEAPWDEEPAAP
ncbi:MAG: tetratricopeptide repeat protein [Acidobacteriota bacterium]